VRSGVAWKARDVGMGSAWGCGGSRLAASRRLPGAPAAGDRRRHDRCRVRTDHHLGRLVGGDRLVPVEQAGRRLVMYAFVGAVIVAVILIVWSS